MLMIAWSRRELNAMLIDADPQRTAHKWSEAREAKDGTALPIVIDAIAEGLKDTLQKARDKHFDVVFIDTPGSIDKTMIFAAAAADCLLLPTRTSRSDLDSLSETLETLENMRLLDKVIVVVNAPRTKAKGAATDPDMEAVRRLVEERFGCLLAPVVVKELPEISRALDSGSSIAEESPRRATGKTLEKLFDFVVKTTETRVRSHPAKGVAA
jgi:chromosome partitioning protein